MARRNVRKFKEQSGGIEAKFLVYIITFGSIGFLALIIWLFGLDIGVVQVGGVATIATAFWVFVGLLVVEYVIDIRYAMNLYKRFNVPYGYAFIPILNCVRLWPKSLIIVSSILMFGIFIAFLFILTPILAYITVTFLREIVMASAIFVTIALISLSIIRGVWQAKFKIGLINTYSRLVGVGAAPVLGFFKSILYVIPIVRIILLLEDQTFINNVFGVIKRNNRIERGDL